MRGRGPALRDRYAALGDHLGLELGIVEVRGHALISVGNVVEMKVAKHTALTYVDTTDRARHLRLDAPLIEDMIDRSAHSSVAIDVSLLDESPEAPRRATTIRATVDYAEGDSRVITVPTGSEKIEYPVRGRPGYADVVGAVRDALLLAEPADEMNCQGPHGAAYTGGPRATPDLACHVVSLKHSICQACLATMAAMGMPLAPPVPKGWE